MLVKIVNTKSLDFVFSLPVYPGDGKYKTWILLPTKLPRADITNQLHLPFLLSWGLACAHNPLGTHHQLSGVGTAAGTHLPFLAFASR